MSTSYPIWEMGEARVPPDTAVRQQPHAVSTKGFVHQPAQGSE